MGGVGGAATGCATLEVAGAGTRTDGTTDRRSGAEGGAVGSARSGARRGLGCSGGAGNGVLLGPAAAVCPAAAVEASGAGNSKVPAAGGGFVSRREPDLQNHGKQISYIYFFDVAGVGHRAPYDLHQNLRGN